MFLGTNRYVPMCSNWHSLQRWEDKGHKLMSHHITRLPLRQATTGWFWICLLFTLKVHSGYNNLCPHPVPPFRSIRKHCSFTHSLWSPYLDVFNYSRLVLYLYLLMASVCLLLYSKSRSFEKLQGAL